MEALQRLTPASRIKSTALPLPAPLSPRKPSRPGHAPHALRPGHSGLLSIACPAHARLTSSEMRPCRPSAPQPLPTESPPSASSHASEANASFLRTPFGRRSAQRNSGCSHLALGSLSINPRTLQKSEDHVAPSTHRTGTILGRTWTLDKYLREERSRGRERQRNPMRRQIQPFGRTINY